MAKHSPILVIVSKYYFHYLFVKRAYKILRKYTFQNTGEKKKISLVSQGDWGSSCQAATTEHPPIQSDFITNQRWFYLGP